MFDVDDVFRRPEGIGDRIIIVNFFGLDRSRGTILLDRLGEGEPPYDAPVCGGKRSSNSRNEYLKELYP